MRILEHCGFSPRPLEREAVARNLMRTQAAKHVATTDESDTSRSRAIALWAFPVLLWWMSAFRFWGAIGRRSDDYALPMVDATGRVKDWLILPLEGWAFFWRPLHIMVVRNLGTWLHQMNWAFHLLTAASFGVLCLALFVLLRRMRVAHLPAAIGAMLPLVHPLNAEVAHWNAAISTSLASLVLVLGALIAIAWQSGGRWLRAFVVFPMIGFAIPSLNEQASAGVPVVFLACLAASPELALSRRRLARALAPCLLIMMGVGVYVALYLWQVPDNYIRGPMSVVALEEIPERATFVLTSAVDRIAGAPFLGLLSESMSFGWQSLNGWSGVLIVSLFGLLGGLWIRFIGKEAPIDEKAARAEGKRAGVTRHCLGILIGLGIFVLGWTPVILISNQGLPPRVFLLPLLGLAITIAFTLNWIGTLLDARPRLALAFSATLRLALIPIMLAGSLSMIGLQRAFREQSRIDVTAAQSLTTIAPELPPNSIIIPFNAGPSPTEGRFRHVDAAVRSVWLTRWSAAPLVRWTFQREDISAVSRADARLLEQFGEFLFIPGLPPSLGVTLEDGRIGVPIEHAVPITIDERGQAQVVPTVWMEQADLRDIRIDFPFAHTPGLTGKRLGSPVAISENDSLENPIRMRWLRGNEPATFRRWRVWGVGRLAAPLDSGNSSPRMTSRLPRMPSGGRLLMRAAIPERSIREMYREIGELDLVVEIDHLEVARVHLSMMQGEKERRWTPIIVDIPPNDRRKRISVRVETSPNMHAGSYRIWLSEPALVLGTADDIVGGKNP